MHPLPVPCKVTLVTALSEVHGVVALLRVVVGVLGLSPGVDSVAWRVSFQPTFRPPPSMPLSTFLTFLPSAGCPSSRIFSVAHLGAETRGMGPFARTEGHDVPRVKGMIQ
jgi:hypothetical protein